MSAKFAFRPVFYDRFLGDFSPQNPFVEFRLFVFVCVSAYCVVEFPSGRAYVRTCGKSGARTPRRLLNERFPRGLSKRDDALFFLFGTSTIFHRSPTKN